MSESRRHERMESEKRVMRRARRQEERKEERRLLGYIKHHKWIGASMYRSQRMCTLMIC
jgi:hypothetical protein